jgi:hypothetical protein
MGVVTLNVTAIRYMPSKLFTSGVYFKTRDDFRVNTIC